jgi:hypothetical protein
MRCSGYPCCDVEIVGGVGVGIRGVGVGAKVVAR